MANADDSAVAALAQRLVVEHLDLDRSILDGRRGGSGERGWRKVARRGVDPVAGQGNGFAEDGRALEGRLRGLVAGQWRDNRRAAEGRVALLVAVVGVRPERQPFDDSTYGVGVGRGKRHDRLLAAGEGAGRRAGCAAQRLGLNGVGDRAETDGQHDLGGNTVDSRQLGDLTCLALGAERGQGRGEPPLEGVVEISGVGEQDRRFALLRHTDDERVGSRALQRWRC